MELLVFDRTLVFLTRCVLRLATLYVLHSQRFDSSSTPKSQASDAEHELVASGQLGAALAEAAVDALPAVAGHAEPVGAAAPPPRGRVGGAALLERGQEGQRARDPRVARALDRADIDEQRWTYALHGPHPRARV